MRRRWLAVVVVLMLVVLGGSSYYFLYNRPSPTESVPLAGTIVGSSSKSTIENVLVIVNFRGMINGEPSDVSSWVQVPSWVSRSGYTYLSPAQDYSGVTLGLIVNSVSLLVNRTTDRDPIGIGYKTKVVNDTVTLTMKYRVVHTDFNYTIVIRSGDQVGLWCSQDCVASGPDSPSPVFWSFVSFTIQTPLHARLTYQGGNLESILLDKQTTVALDLQMPTENKTVPYTSVGIDLNVLSTAPVATILLTPDQYETFKSDHAVDSPRFFHIGTQGSDRTECWNWEWQNSPCIGLETGKKYLLIFENDNSSKAKVTYQLRIVTTTIWFSED